MNFKKIDFKNTPDGSTGLLFIRAYNRWHSIIKMELRKLGITHPQFVILTSLYYLSTLEENITQSSIAKMADMDVMTTSQVIKGLEKKELIRRMENPKDSRANKVELLEKGYEMVKESLPIVEKIDNEFFGVLKEKEVLFRHYLLELK